MFCWFDLYLTVDLVKTESILCLCVKDSDLIKRSSSSFHRGTPCLVILREGRCGAELWTKSWKSARKAVSSSAWGGDGLEEGARGQLQGDVEDELCCGWKPRAVRVPGQTEEPCILLLPVWGRRWVSRGQRSIQLPSKHVLKREETERSQGSISASVFVCMKAFHVSHRYLNTTQALRSFTIFTRCSNNVKTCQRSKLNLWEYFVAWGMSMCEMNLDFISTA